MAVSTAHARALTDRASVPSVTSWTNARADALRQALRMTKESCADHLGLSVRTVAYWRERPDSIPQQRNQEILDAALERASDHVKARFERLVAIGSGSGQQPVKCDIAQGDAGSPAESGQAVALIDDLIGADMADRQEIAQAGWLSGTASSVISSYLFSSPTWHHEQTPLTATPNTAAARIRRWPST